jgi:hypothetical protein
MVRLGGIAKKGDRQMIAIAATDVGVHDLRAVHVGFDAVRAAARGEGDLVNAIGQGGTHRIDSVLEVQVTFVDGVLHAGLCRRGHLSRSAKLSEDSAWSRPHRHAGDEQQSFRQVSHA